ncbi:hypothetical protein AB9P05_09385 [Roseivirga sp. BDSF3-8]|uniref:hypothetical protein n=1 Tax=Roseivirga sp. BDSF3-8 TaxID=3241598 RepID=UPI0035322D1D
MVSKFNEKAGESYSRLAATEIADDHFRRNDFITGSEILELTPIRQINLFVVKHLFARWQEESARLRSPFFDYEAPEVKHAMEDLMNTLSRHIRIGRNHFEPLLRRAAEDTLFLIFSPYDFYRRELENHRGNWTVPELASFFKYYRINKFLADGVLMKAKEEGASSVSVERVIHMLDEVVSEASDHPEETEVYLEQLNRFAPIREDQLYTGEQSFSATGSGDQQAPALSREDEQEAENRRKIEEEEQSIYQRYEREMTTVHDRLKSNEDETGRPAIHQGAKVDSLRKTLTINQKFMFTRSLFSGDEQVFNETLQQLDGFTSISEARQYLNSQVAGRYGWDDDSEEVEEFYLMLQRKYA